MIEKYGTNQKNCLQQKYFIFNFTKVSEMFVQIDLLVTRYKMLEKMCSILYANNLFEKYEQYKKVYHISKGVSFFDYTA